MKIGLQCCAAVSGALLTFLLAGMGTAHAQDLHWDNNSSTSGAQGGTGTWNLSNTNWWNGAANQTWPNTATRRAVFASTAGTVTLGSDVVCDEAVFQTSGYQLRTSPNSTITGNLVIDALLRRNNGGVITVNGSITANAELRIENNASGGAIIVGNGLSGAGPLRQGGAVAAADRYSPGLIDRGLHFTGGGTHLLTAPISGTDLNADPVFGARDFTTITYDGNWEADGGNMEVHLVLLTGGRLIFGPNARLDLIQATTYFTRQVWMLGDGTGTLEFDAGFIADRSAFGTVPEGTGSLRLGAVTLVTHHSQSIPLSYRPASFDATMPQAPRANAHLVFEAQHGGRWRTETNPQTAITAVWPAANCIIETQTDLTHIGTTHPYTDYTAYNGWQIRPLDSRLGTGNVTMTKTGPAALILNGEQAYAPDAVLHVDMGRVDFNTNPTDGQGQAFTNGQNLNLFVRGFIGDPANGKPNLTPAAAARVNCNAPMVNILTATVGEGGTLAVNSGTVLNLSTLSLLASSQLETRLSGTAPSSFGQVQATVSATLDGLLRFSLDPAYIPAASDQWTILTTPSLSGAFASPWARCPGGRLAIGYPAGSVQLDGFTRTGDYNLDGMVTTADLFDFLSQHGLTGPSLADLEVNGQVDAADLASFFKRLGSPD